MDDPSDLVESRSRELGPRGRRLLGGLAVLAVAAAALVWQLDSRARVAEFHQLMHCVTTAEADWSAADRPVSAMGSYVQPSLDVSVPLAVRRGLYGMVAAKAAAGLPAVRRDVTACREVGVSRFHGTLRAARAAYVEWLAAAVDRLSSTAADGAFVYSSSDGLTSLRAVALSRLVLVAPDEPARQQLLRVTQPR
jgi:hypothetical protein